jgi:hypothetical protein
VSNPNAVYNLANLNSNINSKLTPPNYEYKSAYKHNIGQIQRPSSGRDKNINLYPRSTPASIAQSNNNTKLVIGSNHLEQKALVQPIKIIDNHSKRIPSSVNNINPYQINPNPNNFLKGTRPPSNEGKILHSLNNQHRPINLYRK